MNDCTDLIRVHPQGEPSGAPSSALVVDTYGGRIHVEWDPQAAVTPLGQLPFFVEFLKTADLFEPWVSDCPLRYSSPNAPSVRDILGTMLLSALAGHKRYAHITTIRSDGVNPALLGMSKVASEDSVRRAFMTADKTACADWQRSHLRRCYEPLLREPWILDVDTTVKTIYGHQEGAVVGYNPHKRGRPSHAYHTYFIAAVRLVLDVEVQAGNRTAAKFTAPGLFSFLDSLKPECKPSLLRGDIAFGNEGVMVEAERRGQPYLFKLRQTRGVRRLVEELFGRSDWTPAGKGWQGAESRLRLHGWSRDRRVVVLRRELSEPVALEKTGGPGQQQLVFAAPIETERLYEYAVLVTSAEAGILTLAQLYRDRADSENPFDELKNQWGWSGFTTCDLGRCQIMARHIALVYNWWSLFVRLAIPERHAEAMTSRPLLLHAVAKQTAHAGQTRLTITSVHAEAGTIRKILSALHGFLCQVRATAEQLDWHERWRLILSRIFVQFLRGRVLAPPRFLENSA